MDRENPGTPERTDAGRGADAMADNLVITLSPEELIREFGAMVGVGPPEALLYPGMGHHTAAQCPYLGCPGPHAVGPYRTDCPMCKKEKTIEYGVACSACGYLWRAVHDPDAEVRYRLLADVIEQPVTWLWPKYLAAGKLNLLIGDPDIGKSLFVCDLAARLTTGKPWPDGAPAAPIGNVMLLSSEDAPEDTLRLSRSRVRRVESASRPRVPPARAPLPRPASASRTGLPSRSSGYRRSSGGL